MRLRALLLLALLLPVGLLVGCGGDDSKDSPEGSGKASSETSSSEATASDPTISEAPAPSLPSQDDLEAYFTAVAAYDIDALAAAEELAADGSPAQGYVAYLGELAASAVAAGQPADPAELEEADGGFKACGGTGTPDECVVWSDFEAEDGRLSDFTVNGTSLDEALVDLTGQALISTPGVYEVQPEHAYLSPQSGTLFVLVKITAGDVRLAPKPGLYIEQDQTVPGIATRAPARIEAGSGSQVLLAFPDAQGVELDGQVTFDLGVQGASPESIGFGLAGPAPA